MNKLMVFALVAVASVLPATANASAETAASDSVATQVDSFRLFGHAHSWHALDRDSLIVWATPSKAYLVELRSSSPNLRHAFGIGLTSTMGRVSAGFDDVIVEGWRYPIKSIYALDREEAKALVSKKDRSS